MKKITVILLLLTLFAVIFCSCSAYSPEASDVPAKENNEPGVELEDGIYSGERKIIVTSEYNIETTEFDVTLEKLQSAVEAAGGYTENSRIYSDSDKRAELVYRIPNSEVQKFTTTVTGAGNITYQTRTGQDVTLQYTDISARLQSLKAERDRVTALMNEAQNVSETMEISKRLSEIEQEYNSLQSQLNQLSNSTDFVTFKIKLTEVVTYTNTVVAVTFWQKVSAAFKNSFTFFGNACQALFIGLIYMLPLIIVASAITVTIILIVKKKKKNRK